MIKILIIDDERPIRETLEMFLREKGYEVLTSENGERGLEAVQRERPNIVILDIRLPGMNGLEVLRRIKEKQDDIHVIMITAYHDMETTDQAMKLGAYKYIHKPLDVDEFEIAIEKVVSNLFQEMRQEGKKTMPINRRRL
ncbi:MAG TPA: response regulator [Thermodesulfobacteriota bacterium]|nr:response regulator [Thermodesulfobacteriota bacterium]